MGAIVLVAAQSSIRRELPQNRHMVFYTSYLLCLTGLLGILATGDAFNVFVFLEISSLSS
jgi:multicomponent Na+:H+ antiporter subunit D